MGGGIGGSWSTNEIRKVPESGSKFDDEVCRDCSRPGSDSWREATRGMGGNVGGSEEIGEASTRGLGRADQRLTGDVG